MYIIKLVLIKLALVFHVYFYAFSNRLPLSYTWTLGLPSPLDSPGPLCVLYDCPRHLIGLVLYVCLMTALST